MRTPPPPHYNAPTHETVALDAACEIVALKRDILGLHDAVASIITRLDALDAIDAQVTKALSADRYKLTRAMVAQILAEEAALPTSEG